VVHIARGHSPNEEIVMRRSPFAARIQELELRQRDSHAADRPSVQSPPPPGWAARPRQYQYTTHLAEPVYEGRPGWISRRAARLDPLVRANGELIWLVQPWTWWITLTLRLEAERAQVVARFIAWCCAFAAEIVDEHLVVAWAVAPQLSGLPHVHALVAHAPRPALGREWVEQRCKALWGRHPAAGWKINVARYDVMRRAAWYLARHGGWELGVVCPRPRPCTRAGGCVVRRTLPGAARPTAFERALLTVIYHGWSSQPSS
jgi:hypothetical protein